MAVIERLRHRIYVEHMWTTNARLALYGPLPEKPLPLRHEAIRLRQEARQLLDSLFPEDD